MDPGTTTRDEKKSKPTAPTRALSVTLLIGLVVLGMISAGSGVSVAASKANKGGCHQLHTAPKGNGKFAPVASEPDPDYVEACGTTLTITPGDVFELTQRVTEQRDGSTLYEYKGRTTNDITTTDGRKIDELNTGGPYSYLFAPDFKSGTLNVESPALIYPFSPAEQAVFDAAGLPRAFSFTSGTFVAKVDGDGAITAIVNVPHKIISVCDLLKRKDGKH